MSVVDSLVQQFQVAGVQFSEQDQVTMISVENKFAKAKVTTHGGCVLSYVSRHDAQDVLWVSDTALYNGVKPVRGGIPICWPWFGGATKEGLPAHGFVRNSTWEVVKVAEMTSGATQIELAIASNETTLAMWPYAFTLSLTIVVADTLTLTLTTTNKSDEAFELTEAFHTYFSVGNSDGLMIEGLEGSQCLDKLTNAPAVQQAEVLTLLPPMDSVFMGQSTAQLGNKPITIEDAQQQRDIVIDSNAEDAVVWNPGAEIIKGFADMQDHAWPGMVCVEAGNVLDNTVTVASGEQHVFEMVLSSKLT